MLVSSETLRTYHGLGTIEVAELASLVEIEPMVVGVLQQVTGKTWAPRAEKTVVLDGVGRARLWLPEEPRGAVVVSVRGGFGGSWVAVASGDHEVRGRELWNIANGYWPAGVRNVQAVYEGGYDEDDAGLPYAAKLFVLQATSEIYRGRAVAVNANGTAAGISEATMNLARSLARGRVLNRGAAPAVTGIGSLAVSPDGFDGGL